MAEEKTIGLEIKKRNRNNIYRLLQSDRSLSRQDITYKLQLSLPTVTQNLAELQAEGLIAEGGFFGNTGGRKAKAYTFVGSARAAVGLDITRHHITAVVVDLDGVVIEKIRVRHDFSLEKPYFQALGTVVRELIGKTGIDERKILGAGIAVPGLISNDHQTVFYGKILDFTGATCKMFSEFIPYPSALFNDAKAAGYAETWGNPNIRNAFYIMLSNNIGGSVLINKQTYSGENIRSGEVGHMTIVPDGAPCYCGQKGCVEAYCAATILSGSMGDNLDEYFQRLKAGDAECQQQWNRYLHYLAITVNNLRSLFDCTVILGGYVGAYMDEYIDDLRALAAERSTFDNNANYVQVCRYKTEAIAAGAALPFINDFLCGV